MIEGFTPIWKTPSREQAVEILETCRAWTDAQVAPLTREERHLVTALGGGSWSVKDLLGHLATHEHRALVILGARTPDEVDLPEFDSVSAFNAHHLQVKSLWSLDRVELDYATTRDELVEAVRSTEDDVWREKIPAGRGRSALGLVLGKALNGDKYGLFAHDLAHARGLTAAVEGLRTAHP